jgi:hypothetical protein
MLLPLKSYIDNLDFYLSNTVIYFIFGDVTFYYINNDNEVIKYTFNHQYMDGELMAYYIKYNLTKPIYINNFIKSGFNIPQWQILEYYQSNIIHYTKFIKTIALKTYDIIINKKRDINIGIIVSTRKYNNLEKGNFLNISTVHILETDNQEKICLKLYESIQNSKKKQNQPFSIIKTIINTNLNLDYIFNNHRSLSNFNIDNKKFKKVHSNYSLEYVENIFYNPKCKDKYNIILDYDLDVNKYVISDISNINEIIIKS